MASGPGPTSLVSLRWHGGHIFTSSEKSTIVSCIRLFAWVFCIPNQDAGFHGGICERGSNLKLTRRDFLKDMAALGALTVLPLKAAVDKATARPDITLPNALEPQEATPFVGEANMAECDSALLPPRAGMGRFQVWRDRRLLKGITDVKLTMMMDREFPPLDGAWSPGIPLFSPAPTVEVELKGGYRLLSLADDFKPHSYRFVHKDEGFAIRLKAVFQEYMQDLVGCTVRLRRVEPVMKYV